MASLALRIWQSKRRKALDEFVTIRRSIDTVHTGTRHARQQIHEAFVLMLCAQFQGFCRDLHSEGIDHVANRIQSMALRTMLIAQFRFGRKLDTGNPNAGNIGSDFNRFGIDFWKAVLQNNPGLKTHQDNLATMNEWRNAIAHQSFDPMKLGGSTVLKRSQSNAWRMSCDRLASVFDSVLADHLTLVTSVRPW
jgi:hypothetical protein